MPTIAELNAQAARTRDFLSTANLRLGAPSQTAAQFGAATVRNQAGGVAIAPFDFDRRLNVTTGPSLVGRSGEVTRFGTSPRMAARGSFRAAVTGRSGSRVGGGSRGDTGFVQGSREDIQPQTLHS